MGIESYIARNACNILIIKIIVLLGLGCDDLENKTRPEVTTTPIYEITSTTAISGGQVTSDGGSPVTQKGVCWNITGSPTVADQKTDEGAGVGEFTTSLTSLQPNTAYFARAYATNSMGTAYGNQVTFTTLGSTPSVSTDQMAGISYFYARCQCQVLNDGGHGITQRGVCWSTQGTPTIDDSNEVDRTGSSSFTVNLVGLKPNTLYHVRACAVNEQGVGYGIELSFTTKNTGTVNDIEGNTYATVQIGEQVWIAENLRTAHFSNGDSIPHLPDDNSWKNAEGAALCSYNNEPATVTLYGVLYNWHCVSDSRGLCPAGWHVPTENEWETLVVFLGGDFEAGGKMKSIRMEPMEEPYWNSPNSGATNESGFSGLPNGYRKETGVFTNHWGFGFWWHSTEQNSVQAGYQKLSYNVATTSSNHYKKNSGLSVRCIKNP